MAAKLPDQINPTEIPSRRQWDLGVVYELEMEALKEWVARRANENLGTPHATYESALKTGATIAEEVRNNFAHLGDARDIDLLRRADEGKLEQVAPSEGLIQVLLVLDVVAMVAEVAIFVGLALMEITSPFGIVIGVLLALAGGAIGFGLGRLVVASINDGLGWASLVPGLIALVALTVVRASGSGDGLFAVVSITTILALAVAGLTALIMIFKHRRTSALQSMFKCQRWKAAERHSLTCNSGFWQRFYEAELQRLHTVRADIDDRFNESAKEVEA